MIGGAGGAAASPLPFDGVGSRRFFMSASTRHLTLKSRRRGFSQGQHPGPRDSTVSKSLSLLAHALCSPGVTAP